VENKKLNLDDRSYLDSLLSAKAIINISIENGSTELLSTYIKGSVFPMFDEKGIKYVKKIDKLMELIDSEINNIKPNVGKNNFYNSESDL
jgi:hypothetical protein